MAQLPLKIKQNPEIAVPVKGIRGWKVGGPAGLVVFFEIEGEVTFTIGGERRVYRRGDTYIIPDGVPHSGRFNLPTVAMDYFSDPRRY